MEGIADMRIFELFAGIGANSKALKNLGIKHELVGFSEIDKFASKAFGIIHNVSEALNYGDIMKIDTDKLPDFDLLTWGFPCQDISVAGKQKGIIAGETRSGLYYEGLRILKAKLPKYSIIENVKNLTGKKFKEQFDGILKDLESLGYKNYWKVLNAKDYGIPQNRERVFIISIRGEHELFEWPLPFDNGLRLKDMLENEVDERYYINSSKVKNLLSKLDWNNKEKQCVDMTINNPKFKDIGNCIKARYDAGIVNQKSEGIGVVESNVLRYERTEYGKRIRRQYENRDIEEKIGNMREPKIRTDGICNTLSTVQKDNMLAIPCLTPDRLEKRQNGRRFKENGEPMFTLTGQDRHGILEKIGHVGNGSQGNRVYSADGIASTQCGTAGGLGAKTGLYLVNYRIRKLTPKECWRLMGFTDADIDKCITAGISNSQLYKMAGNSIVVNVLESIYKQLLKEENT